MSSPERRNAPGRQFAAARAHRKEGSDRRSALSEGQARTTGVRAHRSRAPAVPTNSAPVRARQGLSAAQRRRRHQEADGGPGPPLEHSRVLAETSRPQAHCASTRERAHSTWHQATLVAPGPSSPAPQHRAATATSSRAVLQVCDANSDHMEAVIDPST